MSLLFGPVFDGGHDIKAVEQWSLEDLSWWYLFRARRHQAEHNAQKEAERRARERSR